MSQSPSIVVVGGMNIDIQGKSLLPFKYGDSNPGRLGIVPGGAGRNIAENLARLGSRVELLSVLGDDDLSHTLEKSCLDAGIGLGWSLRLTDCPSSRFLCLLDMDGSLMGGIADMEALEKLLPERLAERAELLDAADLIIVDANIPEGSIKWLAERYPKGNHRPLLGFDPVSTKKASRGKDVLRSFDFSKPNRAEASILAGHPREAYAANGELSADALASALRAKGLDEAFVSIGFEGLWAEGPGHERWVARLPEHMPVGLEAVNSSGAGDAAFAAIAWGRMQGLSLGERCASALAAAMLSAASALPVNPAMSATRIAELAKGIERERVS